ncbi:hypothetical protein LCGC14_2662550, partial [marine sediment metagenome]
MVAAVIVLAVVLSRSRRANLGSGRNALEILNQRYASGEIDREDYQAFVWIKENVNEDYGKAIVDPWKATAFTAITGKNIHTRIHMAPTPKDNEAYAFIKSGSGNTTFLRENGISI